MKLTTIWHPTYPMSFRERLRRTQEWAIIKIVWHLPERIMYWAVIRAMVATAGNDNPQSVGGMEMLTKYEKAL